MAYHYRSPPLYDSYRPSRHNSRTRDTDSQCRSERRGYRSSRQPDLWSPRERTRSSSPQPAFLDTSAWPKAEEGLPPRPRAGPIAPHGPRAPFSAASGPRALQHSARAPHAVQRPDLQSIRTTDPHSFDELGAAFPESWKIIKHDPATEQGLTCRFFSHHSSKQKMHRKILCVPSGMQSLRINPGSDQWVPSAKLLNNMSRPAGLSPYALVFLETPDKESPI